jgi:predicted MFS family arabinose efflux permease
MIKRLRSILILSVMAKFLVDTATQIFNPFLVIIGSGLGISVVAMGRLVALRSLMGIAAPILGSIADKFGYRLVMRIGLALTGSGLILGALSGNYVIFGISMVLGGVGAIGFTPNLHAYLSSRLPYAKRAMGLGIVEYSWALAGIIGLFAAGLLIEAFSWKTPFYFLGGGLILMALFFGFLPCEKTEKRRASSDRSNAASRDAIEEKSRDAVRERPKPEVKVLYRQIRQFMDLGANAASAWANVWLSGLVMFAMMNVVIIHGGWLEAEYGTGPSTLGLISLIFGLADLSASMTVSLFVDRIGKRRSVIIGVLIMIAGFTLFPFLNRGLVPAVIGIAIPRIGFEFAIVSNFSLLSEQVPENRGKILGLGTTFAFIGSSLAGLTGPLMYLKYGVWGLAPVSLASAVVALLLLIFIIRERSAA